jgi:serine/threonine protein kinase/WD40 repeat protein
MAADPRRVKELFVAALDLPDPQARQALLERECAADVELRQRLEVLLKAHDDPVSALDRPLAAVGPVAANAVQPGAAEAPTSAPSEKSPAGPALAEATSSHSPSEGVGTVIAEKYKLLESLGQGGMGAVFMAQQTAPVKRLVALKLIKLGMDSRQILTRFEAERQALALMDHPNIARVFDAGATDSGRPYFVMELVKGVPITRFCDERQLSTRERLELFIPVCQAIQHAHQKGVIHRDIKPTNVLVALYDDRPVPKVIDFGVAKAAGGQLTDASLVTGFGALVGTPEYMSPEQAQLNQLDIDTRSDVYALGVLLYELLTGTTPIDHKRLGQDALLEILRVIREEEPPRPSTRLSTSNALASIAATRRTEPARLAKLMRGELDWIIMKCLEKERSRRYETANGLARDLERYLHDEVVEARPPSVGYRLRKFVRKHRPAFAMAATVLLLLAAGLAVSTWQAVRARQAESRTAQALTEAEQNQRETEEQRGRADEQRIKAETQAASLAVDIDLKYCEDGEIALGLLRLAETLRTIPEHARKLRECAALNILAWGQRYRPANGPLNHDGFAVTEVVLSPDGATVITLGRDGTTRLWDSLTGKQRLVLHQPPQGNPAEAPVYGLVRFSSDGLTALTIHGGQVIFGDSGGPITFVTGGDGVVRLWDVATGQQRAATGKHAGSVFQVRLSENGSLLVTACSSSPGTLQPNDYTVFFWDASTGQLIRKLDLHGPYPSIDVSPDGKSVLIAQESQFTVWYAEGDRPGKRLPGKNPTFSPGGKFAVSLSNDVIHWWNTSNWQLYRTIDVSGERMRGSWAVSARFLADDVIVVRLSDFLAGLVDGMVFVRNLQKPIGADGGFATGYDTAQGGGISASRDGSLILVGNHVYDGAGERSHLPRGRKYHPRLNQFAEDGRFVLTQVGSIVDLAADKKIDLPGAVCYLKSQETWVALDSDNRLGVLRKADASLDADLLQKWCQVVTRGKLDDNGRFSKLDEATWEKARLHLAALLDANPQAQSLRPAVSDPLYWLRQEIKDSATPLPLFDRLIAVEPTWPNYSQRAAAHAKAEHWDQAIQDELEAARLAGERYWRGGSSLTDWLVAYRSVQTPGHPREQYERALRWMEARTRAEMNDQPVGGPGEYRPRGAVITSLALFRLGRHADALATIRRSDVPMLGEATGMLMSRWNVLTMMRYPRFLPGGVPQGELTIRTYAFDPVDLVVRAMCHHHLANSKEARVCLEQAQGLLAAYQVKNADQQTFLREAESLIEGKARP